MIPRIKAIKPVEDFFLIVELDDGTSVKHDVKTDMQEIPFFILLLMI